MAYGSGIALYGIGPEPELARRLSTKLRGRLLRRPEQLEELQGALEESQALRLGYWPTTG